MTAKAFRVDRRTRDALAVYRNPAALPTARARLPRPGQDVTTDTVVLDEYPAAGAVSWIDTVGVSAVRHSWARRRPPAFDAG